MTVGSALHWTQEQIRRSAGEDAPADARLFVCIAAGMTQDQILMNLGKPMQRRQEEALRDMVRRRNAREPAQYIVGTVQFLGNTFLCDQRALIPRFETEIIAMEASRLARAKKMRDVLDLCTGCGCIAVTVAMTGAQVSAGDFSEDALLLARENAIRHRANVEFFHGDLFDALPEGSVFDMIVSNPPYVRSDDLDKLAPEVRDHEPHMALDGGEDGLLFYRRIASDAGRFLRPGGYVLLEMGDGQAREVCALFENEYEEISVTQDMRGIDRVMSARRRG